MTNKLLLEVRLPATQREYEFRVPFDITVEQGAQLMAQILSKREPVRYSSTEEVDLMFMDGAHAGELLNPKENFRSLALDSRLVDGSRLALV